MYNHLAFWLTAVLQSWCQVVSCLHFRLKKKETKHCLIKIKKNNNYYVDLFSLNCKNKPSYKTSCFYITAEPGSDIYHVRAQIFKIKTDASVVQTVDSLAGLGILKPLGAHQDH